MIENKKIKRLNKKYGFYSKRDVQMRYEKYSNFILKKHLSVVEIAKLENISRQAVHAFLQKTNFEYKKVFMLPKTELRLKKQNFAKTKKRCCVWCHKEYTLEEKDARYLFCSENCYLKKRNTIQNQMKKERYKNSE